MDKKLHLKMLLKIEKMVMYVNSLRRDTTLRKHNQGNFSGYSFMAFY
jgi:hypothetical protein